MSSSTTQLVVALSLLCLILLGFSYSAEAAARPITIYFAGVCIGAAASSNREEKTDVNRLKVISQAGCCCFSIYR
ncbi:hypothetical protein MKW98_008042 [Papaver atlanticum]|uniref:Uncharacterized protein n=1 Tax=Papaver atlanticum TaxID=357466 RepID=A0AAD4X9Q8_9MAGN|nr:hypothetical protein MKW98_008042 [Papaver atlanticum]